MRCEFSRLERRLTSNSCLLLRGIFFGVSSVSVTVDLSLKAGEHPRFVVFSQRIFTIWPKVQLEFCLQT